jgi:large subunit ribosomal protein L12e
VEDKSLAKTLSGTVKSVLGTCLSIGCTVDKQSPKVVMEKIKNGEIKI